MSAKHTPGPWMAHKNERGNYWLVSEKQYNGFQICSTANAEVLQDEANARLIAAAPELLEALKYSLAEWKQYDGANEPNSDTENGRQKAMQLAQDAIAKAEGKLK